MADISKEQAVQLAREVGATPYTNRHYPDRPTHTFNIEQLEAFVNKIAKLGRNAGLDAAKDKVRIHTLGQPLVLAEKLTSVIESLKDNTP